MSFECSNFFPISAVMSDETKREAGFVSKLPIILLS